MKYISMETKANGRFHDIVVADEARQDYIYDDGQFILNEEDELRGIDNITAKVYNAKGEMIEAPRHPINKIKKGKVRRI